MEMNGIAHIALVVPNLEKCRSFYRSLFAFLEMKLIYDNESMVYGVGSRTGILIRQAEAEYSHEEIEQGKVGIHHYCFRARSREDIDGLYEFLLGTEAKIVREPEEGSWAPGYYSVLFEDPVGIRIEANFVPGKGNLDSDVRLPLQ